MRNELRPIAGGAPGWCPFAVPKRLTVNYSVGRAGRRPRLIVDHIADGYGSPYENGHFRNPAVEASSQFWVSRAGVIEQYVSCDDTAWANGPNCNPDMSNPIIAELVASGMVGFNSATISIEHEGRPADGLTPAQIDATRRLHAWIRDTYGIPLNRVHVVGHYQIDRCSRAHCPGDKFPWVAVLAAPKTTSESDALDDALHGLAHYLDEAERAIEKAREKMVEVKRATGRQR